MTQKKKEEVHCGLCQIPVPGDWNEHVNSEGHQIKLRNFGGLASMTQRRISIERLKAVNPNMVPMAEKLANDVDKKMENLLTGKKGYNIYEPDDLEKQDGFITPEGDWYSCDPVYHTAFAIDYLEMFKDHLRRTDKKLLTALIAHIKKYDTAKDYLVDDSGWVSVTVGLTDNYVQPGKKGFTFAQKKTLKKWFLKFKKPFRAEGDIVTDEYHDFFIES